MKIIIMNAMTVIMEAKVPHPEQQLSNIVMKDQCLIPMKHCHEGSMFNTNDVELAKDSEKSPCQHQSRPQSRCHRLQEISSGRNTTSKCSVESK